MKKISLLSIIFLFIFSCKKDTNNSNETSKPNQSEKVETILTKIANAYGYENWDKVEKVNFSFVVNPGENESLRRWEWNPKSGKVTLNSKDNNISYQRGNIKEEYIDTDRAFVNDSFWLLFPFHLVWDDIKYDVVENSKSPIHNKETTKLIVRYPEEGGYTPGDKYEVYINDDFQILEWTYHPKGKEEPALANTFEDLSNFDGIKVNMIHRNPDTGFQLNFRDVSFK